MKYIKVALLFCVAFLLAFLYQNCHASILDNEVELGWPKGEYHVHFGSDPVNLKNGNLFYPNTDLSIPALGFPLEVKRCYNSRSRYKGIFGFGWSSSLDIRAEVTGDKVVIVDKDGFRETFVFVNKGGATRRFHSSRGGKTVEITQKRIQMLNQQTGERRTFHRDGRILERLDRHGDSLKYKYNAKGHLSQVQGAAGRILRVRTDSSGKVVQITDPIGRTIRYEYDSRDNLVVVADRSGHRTGYAYDPLHNLVRIDYPNGGQTRLAYDVHRDLIASESGPEQRSTSYRYQVDPEHPEAWSVEVIDALGNTTRYDYSSDGSHLVITDALGGRTIKEPCPACGGLSSYTDARGYTTRYEYRSKNGVRLITRIDPLGHETKNFYDESTGRLLKKIGANGGVTQYKYDNIGNLIEIEDALGHRTKCGYDKRGLLTKAVNARGGITRFTSDSYGNLIARTDPTGNKTNFVYDQIGRLIKTIDPLGNITTLVYTPADLVASVKDAVGYTVYFEYDKVGNLVKVRDSKSIITSSSYNRAGDLLQLTDTLNQSRRFGYDPAGRMTSFTNTRGFTWRSRYDALGREVETVDPLGNKETRKYDPVDNLVRRQEPGRGTTVYKFDGLNRLVRVTNPMGLSTFYSYDQSGNAVRIEKKALGSARLRYDVLGRLAQQVDPIGREYRYEYDPVGNQIAEWNPLGLKTEYEYDLHNLMTKVIYPGKGERHFKYDAAGNPVESTDFLGRTRRFAFDARSQLVEVHDYDGQVRKYTRDLRGNPVELSVKNGPNIRFSYDPLNRVVKMVGFAGRKETYTYDGESNLLTSTYGNKNEKTFSYDPLNRLTGIRYSDGTEAAYSYDAAGNLVRWRNGHSDVRAEYGPMGTVRSVSYTKPNVHLTMKRDRQGNLAAIILPDGREIQYVYDSLGQLRQIALSDGPSVRLARDKLGRVISRVYPSGLSQFIDYRPNGRISSMRIGTAQDAHRWERLYQYDKTGNFTEEFHGDKGFKYFYDNDRLVKADLDKWGILRLDYDGRGNRIRKEWAGKSEPYEYNYHGQLVRAGTVTFHWDDMGNLVERREGDNRTLYKYNADGQLARAETDSVGKFVSYTYDALGRLIGRRDGTETKYLVQIEGALLLALDEEEAINETRVYEDLDRPLFSQKGKRSLFYHQDLLDNVSFVTDANGAAVGETAYSPFGMVLSGHVGCLTPAYGARPFDPLSGLYDLRFRHYDPAIGLFTAIDPIFNAAPYAFAANNPLKYTDPFGLREFGRMRSSYEVAQKQWKEVLEQTRLFNKAARLKTVNKELRTKRHHIRDLQATIGTDWDYYAYLLSQRKKPSNLSEHRAEIAKRTFILTVLGATAGTAIGMYAASAWGVTAFLGNACLGVTGSISGSMLANRGRDIGDWWHGITRQDVLNTIDEGEGRLQDRINELRADVTKLSIEAGALGAAIRGQGYSTAFPDRKKELQMAEEDLVNRLALEGCPTAR